MPHQKHLSECAGNASSRTPFRVCRERLIANTLRVCSERVQRIRHAACPYLKEVCPDFGERPRACLHGAPQGVRQGNAHALGGAVTLKPSDKNDPESPKVYVEFLPATLAAHAVADRKEFNSFDGAMDEHFSKMEGQRSEQQMRAQQNAVLSKVDKIRLDQEKRAHQLAAAATKKDRQAQLIEYNLPQVDAAINAVNTALASGMNWEELKLMVKAERKAGNPVAGLIHEMSFERNSITLLLSNTLDDAEEEEMTRPVETVEVDLSLTGYANAESYFTAKKRDAEKQSKTEVAGAKAVKAAEKRTQKEASKVKTTLTITQIRKQMWFEKFNWFVSSENFLVLCGRDAAQNDMLVRRYLATGDVFVYSDVTDTPCCVIKHPCGAAGQPVPPLTLTQAGHTVLCRSNAWDSKMVTSAWWVEADQVGLADPVTGPLPLGQVYVTGHRNILPSSQLLMGFGLLFQ
ncbi:hypothetical protein CYMTET_35094, partial [Cymbomonas tetramitiformis]